MRERILKNWTVMRLIYLLMGGFVMIQALVDQQWFVAIAGAYIGSMGLFGLGCASGSCANVNNTTQPVREVSPGLKEIKPGENG
jgi:hypothetical protein